MSEEIKITQDELNELHKLKSDIQKTIYEFGNLYMEKVDLDNLYKTLSEKELSLRNSLDSLKKQDSELMDKIFKKYGSGNLNLSTGVITPQVITPQK